MDIMQLHDSGQIRQILQSRLPGGKGALQSEALLMQNAIYEIDFLRLVDSQGPHFFDRGFLKRAVVRYRTVHLSKKKPHPKLLYSTVKVLDMWKSRFTDH